MLLGQSELELRKEETMHPKTWWPGVHFTTIAEAEGIEYHGIPVTNRNGHEAAYRKKKDEAISDIRCDAKGYRPRSRRTNTARGRKVRRQDHAHLQTHPPDKGTVGYNT